MGLRRPKCNQAVCDTRSGITVQVESVTCPSCWGQQVSIRRPGPLPATLPGLQIGPREAGHGCSTPWGAFHEAFSDW